MIDEILEIPSNLWEFMTGLFDDVGEFSIIGIVFGLLGAGFIYLLRDYILTPFLIHMSPISAMIWGGATYIGCAAGGYFVGKKMMDE